MLRRVLLCAVLLAASACVTSQPKPPAEQPRQLKAVLFPYIPDSAGDNFASLKRRLEHDFEQFHPDIDLDVVFDKNLDLYDLNAGGTLEKFLSEGADAAQVVEIDTLLLGTLQSKGWIQPWPKEAGDAFPAARQAASIDGKSYGTPTYLCTNVVYSGSPSIHSATDGQSLVRTLTGLGPDKIPLATNYSGSWTLPAAYMDGWADTNSADRLSEALALPLDSKTLSVFDQVVNSCARGSSTNPCLDGTFKDNTKAEEAFASGQANAFMGYTERLFFIRKANPALPLPQIISVPLGMGTHPVVFVDALVLNAHCTGVCAADAQAFSEYMSTPEVRGIIALSQDAPQGSLPRYLLQASQSFYESPQARSDPMYQQYAPIVRGARAYPNRGFPENRKVLQKAIQQSLQGQPATR
ncbi:extracellular solute-binding protein [Pyxidicoccus trucidator]|uniref:extracellular solute-binding protein n=1 Tax=Pyxidicoccus trucidator TaxID=2709662 RepID=UPI0013DD63CF|nr:extracellular solute-binding protein [Pyxidicoccus trucidator]